MKYLLILCLLLCGCEYAFGDEISDLLPHIITCESGGDPHAVSDKGAIGLCQITPIVLLEYNRVNDNYVYPIYHIPKGVNRIPYIDKLFRKLSLEQLYEPSINKYVATWYLRRLRDHYLQDVVVFDEPFTFKTVMVQITDKFGTIKGSHHKLNRPHIENASNYKLALILAAWSGGITRLRKVGYDVSKMPKETRRFVRKVLKLYKASH